MLLAMLAFPEHAAQAARSALTIWGLDVAPSLFPYMVLCRTLSSRLNGKRIPAHCVASALGMLGGSPSGAAALSSCAKKEKLTHERILCIAALTGTLSPMFLLSTVREWTKDGHMCRMLLAAHLLGALFAYAVTRLYLGKPALSPCDAIADRDSGMPANPIVESVQAILSVGGCIVFFSVLASTLTVLCPGLSQGVTAILHAVMEAAGGMRALAFSPFERRTQAVLMAAASGFSGLSILSQNLIFLRPHGVNMRHLIALAILRAIGCAGAMVCLLTLIPV